MFDYLLSRMVREAVDKWRIVSDPDGKLALLSQEDRTSLALIAGELSQVKDEMAAAPGVIFKGFWRGLVEAIETGFRAESLLSREA